MDCIVALPAQLFLTTGIPACLWFLTRDKTGSNLRQGGRGPQRRDALHRRPQARHDAHPHAARVHRRRRRRKHAGRRDGRPEFRFRPWPIVYAFVSGVVNLRRSGGMKRGTANGPTATSPAIVEPRRSRASASMVSSDACRYVAWSKSRTMGSRSWRSIRDWCGAGGLLQEGERLMRWPANNCYGLRMNLRRWPMHSVLELQNEDLLVADGNHGEYRPRGDRFGQGEHAFIRAADLKDGRVLLARHRG